VEDTDDRDFLRQRHKEDYVVAVDGGADVVAQFWTQSVAGWIRCDPLALSAQFPDEADRPDWIVGGNAITDGL
jgi:hypothetical protein